MKKKHKIASIIIFAFASFLSFEFKVQLPDTTAQSVITFFSVVFGFYMTSIAILYNATYTVRLHDHIDNKAKKRGTHILQSYLYTSGYWSIFSISSVILFTTFATKNSEGLLRIASDPITIFYWEIDLNILLVSVLFGIVALNIFYMLLLMNTIIDGMVEEAKIKALRD